MVACHGLPATHTQNSKSIHFSSDRDTYHCQNMTTFIHQICFALLLMTASTVGAAGLSAEDSAQATILAEQYPWPEPLQRRRESPTGNAAAKLGVQTISIEIDELKNVTNGSRVRVYQFDHGTQKARRLDIDLISELILRETVVQSVHLPLNQTEIDFAKTVLEQSELLIKLRDEQRRRGHAVFESLDELSIKASVFEPVDNSHLCHQTRCALLSLFDDTRTVFAIEPVVHFATGEVREIGNW